MDVCTDCAYLIANGQCEGCLTCAFSFDPDNEPCQTVADRMVAIWGDDTMNIVLACDEDCEGYFSHSPCDGCGSTLAGDRHPATVLTRKDA